MNTEIIAKDKNGIKRCYGIGKNRNTAVAKCIAASKDYLASRPDIESLFLFDGDTDKPIIDAARYETWEIKQ